MDPAEEHAAPAPSWFGRLSQALAGAGSGSTLRGAIKLIAVILLIKGCLIDQYSIPTESMEPTLHGDDRFLRGDRVLVNKWLYGPRIPFTPVRLWDWKAPERWDMVVFVPGEEASEHPRLIKRIVGLPGERVKIVDGGVEVDGVPLPLPPALPENQRYFNQEDVERRAAQAQTPQERARWEQYLQHSPLRYGVLEGEEYQHVPEGHYFLLGDNSLHSADSRVFGFVPREHLLGRAFAIWWPWPRRRDFTGFSQTWWGMALVYGIPAALALYEVIIRLRKRRA